MIEVAAVFALVVVWLVVGALVVRRAIARGEVVDVRVTPRSPDADADADAELIQWYEQTAARLRAAGYEGEARAFEDELQRQLLRK